MSREKQVRRAINGTFRFSRDVRAAGVSRRRETHERGGKGTARSEPVSPSRITHIISGENERTKVMMESESCTLLSLSAPPRPEIERCGRGTEE